MAGNHKDRGRKAMLFENRKGMEEIILKTVIKRLILCDFKVAATTRAPFDFIAHPPDESMSILGGVTRKGEKSIDERAEEILSISDVVGAQPLFITDGKLAPTTDIPIINSEDLERINLAEDLFSRL